MVKISRCLECLQLITQERNGTWIHIEELEKRYLRQHSVIPVKDKNALKTFTYEENKLIKKYL